MNLVEFIEANYVPTEDYKVKWETVKGQFNVTDWVTDTEAVKQFKKLKENMSILWAELIYSPLDDNPDVGEQVIDSFSRKVFDFGKFGKVVI